MNKDNKGNKVLNYVKELIPYIIVILVVLFIKKYIVSPIQVNGDSMYSTLHDGDIMILDKLKYKRYGVERFDIVVIKTHNTHIIKRVIGLPGDKIEVKDGVLYINDVEYEEKYLDENTSTNDFSLNSLFGTDTVPEDSYFVLGDNRDISLDSRILGFINKKDIEGITSLTVFPFGRIGNKGYGK